MLRRRGRVTDVAPINSPRIDGYKNNNYIVALIIIVILITGGYFLFRSSGMFQINPLLVAETRISDQAREDQIHKEMEEKTRQEISEDTHEEEKSISNDFVPEDECTWRDDELVGRCHGLWRYKEGKISSAQECSALCCKKEDCQSWQFEKKKGCFIGDIVRLGHERAPTGNWCEPVAPAPWKGKRVKSREGETCTFEDGNEEFQCYGLGVKQPAESEKECQELCCQQTERCQLWQWRADKGCFTGKSGNCDKDNDVWIGKRKPPNWT